MKRSVASAIIGLKVLGGAALVLVQAGVSLAADTSTCDTLAGQFESRRATLEAPQVSAALFAAADNGCEALAARVLDAGASVEARDRMGGTALTHAAKAGGEPLVRLLLTRGSAIDLRNVQGSTPLYVAVEANRAATVSALVDSGADVNLPGRAGVTPLAAAAFNGALPIVDLLLAHHADPSLADLGGKTPAIYAAARGSAAIVTRLLSTGIDVNATYGNKLTLLMWAAGHANDVPAADGVALVGALLDKGAAIDARDDRGRTALMIAAALGHQEVTDFLVRRGADRTLKDNAGQTAADLATTGELRDALAAVPASGQSPAR